MIRGHAWRPTWAKGKHAAVPAPDRPCWFMNCGRPRAENDRSRSLTQVKP